jgi:hypothetical protein
MGLKEIWCNSMDWIYLVQNTEQRPVVALVNIVMNFQISEKGFPTPWS